MARASLGGHPHRRLIGLTADLNRSLFCDCGCSSGVERDLAKVKVGRSNRLTRSIFLK